MQDTREPVKQPHYLSPVAKSSDKWQRNCARLQNPRLSHNVCPDFRSLGASIIIVRSAFTEGPSSGRVLLCGCWHPFPLQSTFTPGLASTVLLPHNTDMSSNSIKHAGRNRISKSGCCPLLCLHKSSQAGQRNKVDNISCVAEL